MKRLVIKLNMEITAPLLDIMRAMADGMKDSLVVGLAADNVDEDIRDFWKGELLEGQKNDCEALLGLFGREFLDEGEIKISRADGDAILRGCAAIRLRIREKLLNKLEDEYLEGGKPDINKIPPEAQRPFVAYVFLASLQELIMDHLDKCDAEGEEDEEEQDGYAPGDE